MRSVLDFFQTTVTNLSMATILLWDHEFMTFQLRLDAAVRAWFDAGWEHN